MLIRFISQLLRSNKTQIKSQLTVPILKRVEKLIYMDQLEDALLEVKHLGNKGELKVSEKIQIQLLKSHILTKLGEYDNGLKLAEQAFQECKQLEKNILLIDAIISIATVHFGLNELDKGLDIISNGEKLLSTIINKQEEEIMEREAALKYLKSLFHSLKGDLDLAIELLQDSLSNIQKSGNLYVIADYHNNMGIFHASKGEFDQALKYLQYSLKLFEELGLKSYIVKSLNNIGMIYWEKGNLNRALENYRIGLSISNELRNKQLIAAISLNIGLIYWNMGELDSALDYYQKSLVLIKELGNKSFLASCLNNIGIIFQFKGELDHALEFYQKSLFLEEELGRKMEIALRFNNIGEVHQTKGFLEEATKYYKKSLALFEEIGNNVNACLALFNLVLVAIDRGIIEHAQPYLEKLQEMDSKEKNKHINQKFRLAKALVLKESDRVVTIAEAQKLFQQVAQEEMISLEHNVQANLNLCELLLQELRTTGNEEVLFELNEVLSQLLHVAEEQNSYIWLAKTYWLQSKIALLEFDLKQSQELLTQAEMIAYEKGLKKLSTKISSERDILLSQFNKWEKVLEQKPSVSEIIELTQIEEMVERMIQKKLDSEEEEIMQYAVASRRLVDMWEKK